MRLPHYIDLAQLLQEHPGTHAENRTVGLEHAEAEPMEQIEAWRQSRIEQLEPARWSDRFARYHYWIGLIGGLVAFVTGFLSGVTLLSYSGKEPVNVVYFLALAVGVPLVTMGFTLVSMLRAGQTHNALVHLSPASWMEKIIAMLPMFEYRKIPQWQLNPRLANWLIIERAQMMAWWFAFGLLLALLGVVVTQDVAFAWSTTLSVTPEQFHRLIEGIAAPWRGWLPSAVPSVALIEQSQFFRLGGHLDSAMIDHAAELGQWWKFLTMATLVYALGLRTLVWIVARIGLHRSIEKAAMRLDGVSTVLEQMNTPVVETAAQQPEPAFVQDGDSYGRIAAQLESTYDAVLGWAMDHESIRVIVDALGVQTAHIADPGGSRTLEEDAAILADISGDVLVLVKSWEPPMMEWVDFVEELSTHADRITIAPIGTQEQNYQATPKDAVIWSRKLRSIDLEKVVLWQN